MWREFQEGKSIGTKGSEQGTITKDEEHDFGARITIEKNGCTAPWTITCGIYGGFLHTVFGASEEGINEKYEEMKVELLSIMGEENEERAYEQMRDFAEKY